MICSLIGALVACRSAPPSLGEDAMEQGSRKLAGPNAIDCGRVPASQSPKAATDCALAAFKSQKPFRVRYNLRGIDSNVAAGLAMSPDQKLYAMEFDGDPMGGGGTSPERQLWRKVLCPTPFSVRTTDSGRLTCYPRPEHPAKPDIMSPTFEPY